MRSYLFIGGAFGAKRYCVRDGVDRVTVPVKTEAGFRTDEYVKTTVESSSLKCEVFAWSRMDALSMLAELERYAREQSIESFEYKNLDDGWLQMNFEEFDVDLASNDVHTIVIAKSKPNPMGVRLSCVGRNFSLVHADGTQSISHGMGFPLSDASGRRWEADDGREGKASPCGGCDLPVARGTQGQRSRMLGLFESRVSRGCSDQIREQIKQFAGRNGGVMVQVKGQRAGAQVRWMVRSDLTEVLAISQKSFDRPWTEGEFRACLGNANNIGIVAHRNECVVGYLIYGIKKTRLEVLQCAVAPSHRRTGVASSLMHRLTMKIQKDGKSKITLRIQETNLSGQLFLRAFGFVCVGIQHGTRKGDSEYDYRMVFRSEWKDAS